MIWIKRVYEDVQPEDGFRVLVDRLWPRGVSKDKAKLDLWLKEAAPSDALRKWYHHNEEIWEEFRARYKTELESSAAPLQKLKALENEHGKITLVYAAKTEEYNHALVLKEVLEDL